MRHERDGGVFTVPSLRGDKHSSRFTARATMSRLETMHDARWTTERRCRRVGERERKITQDER
jgi:hypothetical protein